MKVTFGAFRGHFEVTLSLSTSNFMCDACVMHTRTGLVGSKRGKVGKLLVFKSIFEGAKGAEDANRTNKYPRNGVFGAFRGHFELTLSISTSNFRCDACVMHTCTGLVGPKMENEVF